MGPRHLRVLPLLLVGAACSTLDPDVGPPLHAYTLRVGAELITNFDSELSLDSETLGVGTTVDLEDDLGLDNTTQFARADLELRFDRRNSMELAYYAIDRSATHVLDKDIDFGEEMFPSGSAVNAFFDTTILKASYRNTFLVGDNWELGASIGLHTTSLDTGISISGSGVSEQFKVPLPLPVIGLDFTWEIVPKLQMIATSEVFYLKLNNVGSGDEISGLLWDSLIAIEHDTLDHAGLGVGLNYFLVDASAGNDNLTLSTEYDYLGVLLYVRTFF